MPELKFHVPTGAVPPPFVLVEGEEKAGKSTEIAKFTGSDRIGQSYWIELGSGERTGEWYIRVEGAKYILADHDAVSTWRGLNEQVDAIAEDVEKRLAAGEKTPMIVIDSMSAEWKGLSKWADWKARNSKSAKRILANDANADITIGPAYWNPATARHEDLLSKLGDIPAIIIFTARGKEVTEFGKDGQPVANHKTWSVTAQKDLGFFVDCWVRMRRSGPAEIVGCRGIDNGIKVGEDAPETVRKLDLEHLIFERYGFDPDNTVRRPKKQDLDAVALTVDEERQQASDQDDLNGEPSEERILLAAEVLESAKKTTARGELTPLWKDAVNRGLMAIRFSGNTLEGHLTAEAKRITDSESQSPEEGSAQSPPKVETDTATADDAAEAIRISVAKLLGDATNATTRDEMTTYWHEAVEDNLMGVSIAGATLRDHLTEHVKRVKALDPVPSGEKVKVA